MFLTSVAWLLLGLPQGHALYPGRLLDEVLTLAEVGPSDAGKSATQLLARYGIIGSRPDKSSTKEATAFAKAVAAAQQASSKAAKGLQTTIAASGRHQQVLLSFLRLHAVQASQHLAGGDRPLDVAPADEVMRFISLLIATRDVLPDMAAVRRMFALAVCFGHPHWSSACAAALRDWHKVAGIAGSASSSWQALLKSAELEEGVPAQQLLGFLFERLWLDAGEFLLFAELVGLHRDSRGADARTALLDQLVSAGVANPRELVLADWDWLNSQSAEARTALMSPRDLEAEGSFRRWGVQVFRGLCPKEPCQQLLEHIRRWGNTTGSGLHYPGSLADDASGTESHVHESLCRVSWPLDAADAVVRSVLQELLGHEKWPSLIDGKKHVLELGAYSIHRGAAPQGFHRDSYQVSPGPLPSTASNFQVALADLSDCAPLDVVPGSQALTELQLCPDCSGDEMLIGRRLRAHLPRLATSIAPLSMGDVVAYDPRVYHRGGHCSDQARDAPREVLWFTLANDRSAKDALSHADALPYNPFLQEVWKSGNLITEKSLLKKSRRSKKKSDL